MTKKPDDHELRRLLQKHERHQLPQPSPPRESPTIPIKDLPESPPGSPVAVEWNHYRRVVEALLAEGHETHWLLIKNEEIVGIWDTEEEANQARIERFLLQPVLMKQILTRESVLGRRALPLWPN